MRRIGVITFGRSDYSSCLPVMQTLTATPGLELQLMVSGTHFDPKFGHTVDAIRADGFAEFATVPMSLADDRPATLAAAAGSVLAGLGALLARRRPDILLVVGDRYELLSVAAAALLHGVPLAHVSGGDITEGAMDNEVRHAVSKLSHLHFVAMPEHAARLRQMGEEAWRIQVTGDPALDLLRRLPRLSVAELSARLGVPLQAPVFLVTFHPVTRGGGDAVADQTALLAALDRFGGTCICTYPNADPGHDELIVALERHAAARPGRVCLVRHLGQQQLYSLMAVADVMVGNSSSGIWEAPSFPLPAVNVGDRQGGRRRAGNVIDAPVAREAIAAAIEKALSPAFKNSLAGLVNPYGDGAAAARIVNALAGAPPTAQLLAKRFAPAS